MRFSHLSRAFHTSPIPPASIGVSGEPSAEGDPGWPLPGLIPHLQAHFAVSPQAGDIGSWRYAAGKNVGGWWVRPSMSTQHQLALERDTADANIKDKFERTKFVDSLVDLLLDRKARRAHGFVVGLTGPWGSGKSQVMLYAEEKLKTLVQLTEEQKNADDPKQKGRKKFPRVLVVRFNPWLHSGQDDMLRQFFQVIRGTVTAANDPALSGVVSKLDSVKNFVRKYSRVLKGSPGEGVGEAATAALENSLEEEKEHFEKSLGDADASVVVLMDEIDRLSDHEVREVAQTVKSVADFPMFSYLLAYDPDRVAKALGHDDIRLGYQYLEKIVQVQARLPRVDPGKLVDEIDRQVAPLVVGTVEAGQRQRCREVIQHLVPDIIGTPRDARRLAAAITLRKPLLADEVNPFDLLRYCALEARLPILSERLQHRTARITVDGSRELNRRFEEVQEAADCINDILGEYRNDKPLRDLLVYLFPALREGGSEEITRDDDRLCYETPLLSLLNYGPVKGLIPREEAKKALAGGGSAIPALLNKALGAGRLRHAVLRLRRMYRQMEQADELEPAEAAAIWMQVGAFFDRPMTKAETSNWDSWLELTHVFVRGALRNYIRGDHVTRPFVEDLIAQGQVHMSARILIFHMQAYGLEGITADPLLTPQLSEQDTKELLITASGQLSAALASGGDWRLRSVTPLWVIRAGDRSKTHWPALLAALKSPQKPEHMDGALIMAMRYAKESFQGTSLAEDLNLPELARKGGLLQNPEPELRTPTEVAYRFLRVELAKAASHPTTRGALLEL
jgi:hypothetical protein